MSIEQKIVDDLSPLGLPVFQQGDWTGDNLPPEFITYYPVDSTDVRHYANLPTYVQTQMQVNIYTDNPDNVSILRKQVSDTLLAANWTRNGRGYGSEMEESTGRFPWHMIFYYFEKE